MTAASLGVLQCPNSSRKLLFSDKETSLNDSEGQHRYPILGGIPWLVADPAATIWQWKLNLTHQLASYQQEEESLKEDLKTAGSKLLKERLQRLKEARMHDRRAIANLLRPLLQENLPAVDLARTLASKVPLTQSLTGYYSNIHRDWSWCAIEDSVNENVLARDLVWGALGKALPSGGGSEPQFCAVFGAGCCRLAYDLHESFGATQTFAVDINPLLLAVAKRVTEGGTVELHEYPIAPIDIKSVAVKRVLEAPARIRHGFHFILADALNPPIQPGSLDLVVTPWFVDIVPETPQNLLARINSCLKLGGIWCNFGTLVFHSSRFSDRLSCEEFEQCVLDSGFEFVHKEFTTIPYMASPASSHSRRERVVCFSARKVRSVELPQRFQFLPEWATDNSLPVPLLQPFADFFTEHRTYAQILSLVDGRRSVDEISRVLAGMFGMDQAQARESFLKIAVTLYEKHASKFI